MIKDFYYSMSTPLVILFQNSSEEILISLTVAKNLNGSISRIKGKEAELKEELNTEV